MSESLSSPLRADVRIAVVEPEPSIARVLLSRFQRLGCDAQLVSPQGPALTWGTDVVLAVVRGAVLRTPVTAGPLRELERDGVPLLVLVRAGTGGDIESVAAQGQYTLVNEDAPDEILVEALCATASRARGSSERSISVDFGPLLLRVVHDFKNLLATIQVTSVLLENEAPSPLLQQVRELQNSVQRGVSLTSQLIALGRPSRPVSRSIDVNEALRHGLPFFQQLVRDDVRVGLSFAPSLSPVGCDPYELEQVVANLVRNAQDAMADGGEVLITTKAFEIGAADVLEQAPLSPGEYVCIEVRDSGTGVPLPLRSLIFDPFFTTKAPGIGTGLGLSSARAIARAIGGDVRLAADEGSGASFLVLLPIARRRYWGTTIG